jgi:tripartite-type tricarboxylate transporter receptor subunit TctC
MNASLTQMQSSSSIAKLAVPIGMLSIAVAACTGTAHAQAPSATGWPTKPVRLIVDFPAGGVSDTIARTVGGRWSEGLGQPVVVDPRPGAGGMLAYGLGMRAQPDGHTISFVSAPFVLLVSLHEKPQYTVAGFAPIGLIGTAPNVLVASPKVPARGVKELIGWAKGRSDSVNFASVGIGSSPHLSGELFNQVTGVRATHVPFNGSGPAMNDLMAGRVDFMFVNLPSAAPLVKAGKLQLLALGGDRRIPAYPDTATVAESGFPGFRSIGFYGIAAPAGIPATAGTRLRQELARAIVVPEVRERLQALGVDPAGSDAGDFGAFLLDETRRWERVVREAKIRLEVQ